MAGICFWVTPQARRAHVPVPDPGAMHLVVGGLSSESSGACLLVLLAQEFEDPVWRSYDEVFHEKAAATRNMK